MKTNTENNNAMNNNRDSIVPWYRVGGKAIISVPVSFDTFFKVGGKEFADQLYKEVSTMVSDGFMTAVGTEDLTVETMGTDVQDAIEGGIPVVFTGNDNVESMEVCE